MSYSNRARKYDCLNETCKAMVNEAVRGGRFDKDKFSEWYDASNVNAKRNPSAWFAVVFPKELAKGTFDKDPFIKEPKPTKKRTVQEYLKAFESWDEFPEPIDDEDAMNQDEATKFMLEGTIKTLCGSKAKAFTKPIPPKKMEAFLKGVYPESLREEYRRHPEYLENTFISVYNESRLNNEPMRKTCERKGLKMEGLIW